MNHMEALESTLRDLLNAPGAHEKLFDSTVNPIKDVDSGVLQSAGFDYKEDGVQKRIQLNIPPSRFGISPDDDVAASKRKYIEAILRSMKTRTADSQDLLKNFDLTHKLTKRADAQKKLTALRKFLPKLNVTKATMQYCALMTSLANSAQYQSIEAKLKFALRTGGYENIVPVFQLALTLPLENACCERGFSAMNDIKTAKGNKLDKPLFPLMLLAMYGKTHNFDFAKLGVLMASTWEYSD